MLPCQTPRPHITSRLRANHHQTAIWITNVTHRLLQLTFAFFTLVGCNNSSPSPSVQTPPPPPQQPTQQQLGNLTNEVGYFQTAGNGTIQIATDPNTPDPCCFATIIGGQRYVLLSPNFFTYPPALQTFFLAHEHGHHYLQHEATSSQGYYKEQSADAYGIRVLAALNGESAAQSAISLLASANAPGDPTHPPSAQRAAYMSTVLAAMLIDPTNVPAPPSSPSTPTSQMGTLVIHNTTQEPGIIYINYTYVGVIPSGLSNSISLQPGNYRIDLQGQFSGLWYNPAFVTVLAGQTVHVP